MVDDVYTCSECGKQFTTCYAQSVWPWKTTCGGLKMQCDYNCHNHASLRTTKLGYMTLTKYKEEVKRSENFMKEKGKTILHPIDVDKKKSSISKYKQDDK